MASDQGLHYLPLFQHFSDISSDSHFQTSLVNSWIFWVKYGTKKSSTVYPQRNRTDLLLFKLPACLLKQIFSLAINGEPTKLLSQIMQSNHSMFSAKSYQRQISHQLSLHKHTYSNIYRKFYNQKRKIFRQKIDIFYIPAQNIDCGYSLEPPWWGSSYKYPQSMFFRK